MKNILPLLCSLTLLASNASAQPYEIRHQVAGLTPPQKNVASCLEIKQSNASARSGQYTILIDGESIDVECNMEKDGGGWTQITRDMIANHLQVSFKINEGMAKFDNGLLLFGDTTSAEDTDVRADISIPFGYQAFYFEGLAWRDYPTTGTWDQGKSWIGIPYSQKHNPNDPHAGDITVGSSELQYPVMSYYQEQGARESNGAVFTLGIDGKVFNNGAKTQTLTFRGFEYGSQDEDVYPFYRGSVWVR